MQQLPKNYQSLQLWQKPLTAKSTSPEQFQKDLEKFRQIRKRNQGDASALPAVQEQRCPRCSYPIREFEHGFIRPEDGSFARARKCPICSVAVEQRISEKRALDYIETIGGCNFPDNLQGRTLDTFPAVFDQEILDEARDFASGIFGRGAFIFGNFGRGKSGLAKGICEEALKRGESAYFISSAYYLQKLRQSFGRRDDHEFQRSIHTMQDTLYNVKWLCIDDLGSESGTDFALEEILLLIERRRSTTGFYTIVTSNYALCPDYEGTEELFTRWVRRNPRLEMDAQRIVERLDESFYPIYVHGVNLRQYLKSIV